MQSIKIDVVSDVVCPWCAIGYKHLERALERLGGEIEADLSWHAFELNPDTPPEGENLREHLIAKYGMTRAQSDENRRRITETGAAAGFTFNFTDDMRTFDTFDCHRLLFWARGSGHQTDLKLALFDAYFTQGQNLNEPEVLVEAARRAGLDADKARSLLESDTYRDEVRAEQARNHEMGIRSVPTYIINGKYAITGGQPPEVFEQALRQIAGETEPV